MKKGDYYVLYRADFKPIHKCKKLNLVFYSEFQQKLTNEQAAELAKQKEDEQKSRENLHKMRSTQGSQLSLRKATTDKNQMYEHDMAVEFERLDIKSFDSKFFDRMEQINYARLI